MDCKEFQGYIGPYIDGYLTVEEAQDFVEHMEVCECCKVEYENMKSIIGAVNEIEEVPLPQDFTLELRKKLMEENTKGTVTRKLPTTKWKYVGGLVAALLIVVVSSGILSNLPVNKSSNIATPAEMAATEESGAVSNDMAQAFDADLPQTFDVGDGDIARRQELMDQNVETMMTEEEGMPEVIKETSRKIIQRGEINIEVEDFDEAHQKVLDFVQEAKGYIQRNEVYYHFQNREKPEESLKNANMELRIPTNDFGSFFEKLKDLGTVVQENTSGEDITERYLDIDNQVQNLKIQEERLREILQKAEEVEDLLKIENELNRVRTQINYLTSTLKEYDGLVSMATIHLHIRQVKAENLSLMSVDDNIWNKAKNNFINSMNNIVRLSEEVIIGLFGLIPILILMGIVLGIVGSLGYKKWKKKDEFF